eukprot:c13001_g1_i4.p1 GENE.c13001_g1_i4~~c13001_g1_i4.p1  ORF type:complete len:245 (+),score=52.14 c13001_g1_i4:1795-2529(+)
MLVGLGLLVGAVPLIALSVWHVSQRNRRLACQGTVGLVSWGLVTVTSCVTIRNYPIWRIFFNPLLKKVRISQLRLLQGIVGAVGVDVAVVVPLLLRITTSSQTNWCSFRPHDAVVLPLLVANFVFLATVGAGAVVMCFKIRNAPSEFHETRDVGRATYNFVTFGVGMVVVGLTTNTSLSRLLSLSLSILMCVSTFVIFLYLSKVATVRRNPAKGSNGSNAGPRVFIFLGPRLSSQPRAAGSLVS